MYDAKQETRKAMQQCLRAAYAVQSGQSGGAMIPDAMRALLDRMATRTNGETSSDQ